MTPGEAFGAERGGCALAVAAVSFYLKLVVRSSLKDRFRFHDPCSSATASIAGGGPLPPSSLIAPKSLAL